MSDTEGGCKHMFSTVKNPIVQIVILKLKVDWP